MRLIAAFTVGLMLLPASSVAIEIFACEPEWGALAKELTGDDAGITIATSAFQDPHRLQAKPSLIAAVRRADMIICTGADLEIGWLPLLLRRAGNASIQPGKQGHFMAADHVRKLEVPQVVDRSQGDIHPQGNPHIHLDPRNIRRIGKALAERLSQIDPADAPGYAARLADFERRWSRAVDGWEQRAGRLSGLRLASNHRSFSYLARWLNLDIVATLEPKPGIPASGSQLAELLEQLTPNPPAAVIRTPYAIEKPSVWLSARLGIPELKLPYTVGGADNVTDLFALFEQSLVLLEELIP